MSDMNDFSFTDNGLSRNEALLEALLFASGEPVDFADIASVLKLSNKETEEVIEKLKADYESRNGGIALRRIKKGYQLYSKPEFHDDMRDYFAKPRAQGLSRAAMETLSIIAYNQPITRNGIEIVRGVNSDSVLLTLIDRGYIYESGRSETPGRPILYSTTEAFLRAMGIEDLEQLPPLEAADTAQEETEQTIFDYAPNEEVIEKHAEELEKMMEEAEIITDSDDEEEPTADQGEEPSAE